MNITGSPLQIEKSNQPEVNIKRNKGLGKKANSIMIMVALKGFFSHE